MRAEGKNKKQEKSSFSFSERKERIILTVSAFAFIVTIVTFIMKLMRTTFSTYTLGNFPFTLEQFLVPTVLSSGILIGFYCLRYLFSEYFTLVLYPTESENKYYAYKADKNYVKLLDQSNFVLYLTLFLLVVESYFSNYYLIFLLVIPLCVGLFLGFVARKYYRERTEKIINWVEDLFSNEDQNKIALPNEKQSGAISFIIKFMKNGRLKILFSWLFVFYFCFLTGVELSNLPGEVTTNFQNGIHPKINIEFQNKDPQDVEIYVYPKNTKNTIKPRLVLNEQDFDESYTRTLSKDNEDSKDIFTRLFKKGTENYRVENERSSYSFTKSIDISPYLEEGDNIVFVSFSSSGVLFDKKYEIYNQIYKQGLLDKFVKEKAEISF